MTTLSETYFNFKVDASRYELEAVYEYLSFIGNKYAVQIYGQEVDIQVRIEEGSLKAWVTAAGIIYGTISGYGSFRSGIEHLTEDARSFGKIVSARFIEDSGIEKEKIYRVEKRLGIPGKINRLLTRIEELEQADYSNQLVRDELKAIHSQVKRIIDDLDSDQDRKLFLSSLPDIYRDIQQPEPRVPIVERETMPVIRQGIYGDYQSDGSLTEFADEVHQHLHLTNKK